jgi:ornithine carbamoyltransferase
MDVTLLCPEELTADPNLRSARQNCQARRSFGITHDIESAYSGATWFTPRAGALAYYGRPEEEWELRKTIGTSSDERKWP